MFELVAIDLTEEQIDKLGAFASQAERLSREMPPGFADLLLQVHRIIVFQLRCYDLERQWREETGGFDHLPHGALHGAIDIEPSEVAP
jgi:hypothetical protein